MTVAIFHTKEEVVVPPPSPTLFPALSLEVAFSAPAAHGYKDSVLSDQAGIYLRLGEALGPTAVDEVGNQNGVYSAGIALNQASLLTGDANGSALLSVTGGNDYVEIPDHLTMRSTNEFSLEMWIKPTVLGGLRTLVRKELSWGMSITPSNTLYLTFWDPALTEYVMEVAKTLEINTTYHLVYTFDLTWIRAYVNGEMVFAIGTPTDVINLGTQAVRLGLTNLGTLPYDGYIDEFAYYPRELSPERVAYHYAARLATTTTTWTTISDDVTSRLRSFSSKRGRADELRNPETGTLTGELNNQDRRFDPANAASPYFPNVKPVRQVRLRATMSGLTYDVWRGDVQEWPQQWEARENVVPLLANDAWDFLASAEIEAMTRGIELSGARVNAILDAAGWPRARRNVSPGNSLVAAIADEKGNAKSMLDDILHVESGQLFTGRNGDIVFRDRMYPILNATPLLTLSNQPSGGEFPITDAKPQETKNSIRNSIEITVSGGTLVKAEDPVSMLSYRKRSYKLDLPFASLNEAQAKAEWTLSQYKEPFLHIAEAVVEPQMDTGLWAHVLGREIGDRVRFKIFPPGGGSMIDLQTIIEYVEHRQVVGHWTTKWKFSPAGTITYWILGTSQLGTDTRLAY